MSDQLESGPFKLSCPVCKGTFTGRLPARPAIGACPICKKDLVLLPNGTIQAGKDYKAPTASPPPLPTAPVEEEPVNQGKAVFATLLFLIPASILLLLALMRLPEKTYDIFHRMGKRAGKGLLEMKGEIDRVVNPDSGEVRKPTRQTPKRS